MGIKSSDYLYATARIRAMESTRINREKCERMLEAKTAAEAMAQIGFAEGGIPAAREAWFSARLGEAYSGVLEMMPSADAIRFLQYPYDCTNLKTAIKCHVRRIACTDMLISFASLPIEQYPRMVDSRDFGGMPEHMAAAASEAIEAYTRTADPQQIDLILDRACFADMCADADCAFSQMLIRAKIDLTNLMTFLRVLRMGLTAANRAMLEGALLEGGEILPGVFLSAMAGGESRLAEHLGGSICAEVLEEFDSSQRNELPALAELERACDDAWLARVRGAKYIAFGAEIPVSYLIEWEYAVKNMRIICAGKDAGLDNDTIRARLRS
ncbi:MAG: V-type ATPase subunit [Clostridia bacterium]|nr:V-type ATPase subunit [Clostridia bacterium]